MQSFAEKIGFDKETCIRRLPEFLVLVALATMSFLIDYGSTFDQTIPQVMVFDDVTHTYKAVANNPDLSYPIKLDGEKCMPTTLQLCLDGYLTAADNKCCKTMLEDKDAEPYSTVPFSLLLTIMFPLPFIVLLLRVYAGYALGKEPRPWVTFVNVVIGLLYTLVYTNLITEAFKHLVGRPRPMYYALMIFSEVFKDDREHTRDQANLSFPSGHSSLSMAAWAFVAYILFADALALRHKHPKISYAFVHIAGGGIMFAIWVASTRITDYWHHVSDTLAGMVLGAAVSFIVYSTLIDCSWNESKTTNAQSEARAGVEERLLRAEDKV